MPEERWRELAFEEAQICIAGPIADHIQTGEVDTRACRNVADRREAIEVRRQDDAVREDPAANVDHGVGSSAGAYSTPPATKPRSP